MTIEWVLIPVTLIVLTIATYTDLKTREVPDWLNYGFLFAVFGIRAIFSLENGWSVLLAGILGFALCFILACLFYYTKQWGGGDSKLLMGMGAALGISYPLTNESFTLLWFFLAVLFIGSFWGLIWMIFKAYPQRKACKNLALKYCAGHKTLHFSLALLTVLFIIPIVYFPLLWPLLLFPLGLFYLFVFITSVEKTSFIHAIPLSKATEGDWLVEDVHHLGKCILTAKTLEKEDLIKLKHLAISTIVIKEGVPFTPSFLASYMLILLGKDAFTLILSAFFT
ncbi:MAG: A24 family peptidase [Nanoarchaeota archaeon]